MEHEILVQGVHEIVSRIWSVTLGEEVCPVEGADGLSPDVVASVEIDGAWGGAVHLLLPNAVAVHAAAVMFDTTTPTEEQETDSLRELVNVLGGNLKTVLPEPCALSAPKCQPYQAGQDAPALRACFASPEGIFAVDLRKR